MFIGCHDDPIPSLGRGFHHTHTYRKGEPGKIKEVPKTSTTLRTGWARTRAQTKVGRIDAIRIVQARMIEPEPFGFESFTFEFFGPSGPEGKLPGTIPTSVRAGIATTAFECAGRL